MSVKKPSASAVVDSRQDIHEPLDYSFKAANNFHDLLREKPRIRRKNGEVIPEEDLVADESTDTVDLQITASHSTALLLHNNNLIRWDGFSEMMSRLFVDYTSHLCWLDLALNELIKIDSCLLECKNLTMLYLHGNAIGGIAEIDKLSALHRLKSLTLHGNHIESNVGYRQYVICKLPQLQTFDFSGITKSDRATAETWRTMIAPLPKKIKQITDE